MGSEGGNWRMELVACTLHTTSEHGVSSITSADAHTSAVPVVDLTDAPTDLNSLVRFAERRNLVSACVPSHLNDPYGRSVSGSYLAAGHEMLCSTQCTGNMT